MLFPKAGVVPAREGAVEFWGRLIDPPASIDVGHRPYFISGRSDRGPDQDNIYVGFNANNGVGLAGIVGGIGGGGSNYPEQGLYTSRYAGIYADILGPDVEAWHHYALVWDEDGLPGIGDGTRPVALYVDGVMVSQEWQLYDGSVIAPFGETFALLDNWNGEGGAAIDNLKLWDFAKTDFSDRFVEGFTKVGTAGADTLLGSVAGDDLRGLGGDDVLRGFGGDDLLRGGAGRDLLSGGVGDDTLRGGGGDDRLFGGEGDDRITDGAGSDRMTGGEGADLFRYVTDCKLDEIRDFGAGDRIDLTAWHLSYADLHIVDGGDGAVLVTSQTEAILVRGAGCADLNPADLTEDQFIFADGPDLDWVQWGKADGGNGHWFALVERPEGIAWTAADAEAEALEDGAGHLVSLTSRAENDFVYRALVDRPEAWNRDLGPHIGLQQSPTGAEPAGGWGWTTGEAAAFLNWEYTEPNDLGGLGPEEAGHFYNADGYTPKNAWNDIYDARDDIIAYVVEVDDPLAFG